MEYHLYILVSQSNGRLYIGSTNDVERRQKEHHANNTKSTRGKGPWNVLFTKAYETKAEAQAWERKLKSWKNKNRILEWVAKQAEE